MSFVYSFFPSGGETKHLGRETLPCQRNWPRLHCHAVLADNRLRSFKLSAFAWFSLAGIGRGFPRESGSATAGCSASCSCGLGQGLKCRVQGSARYLVAPMGPTEVVPLVQGEIFYLFLDRQRRRAEHGMRWELRD